MRLRDIAAVLTRRWYLVLLTLVLTAGVGYAALQRVPTTYQTTASVVLLPPTDPENGPQNRLLDLGGLGQAVDVVIRAASAKDVRERLQGPGSDPPAQYAITPDFTSNAPLLIVQVTGKRSAVDPLMTRVLETIPRELEDIQASVDTPTKAKILALPVTRDKAPQALSNRKLRSVAVLTVGAFALGLLAVAALDGLLVARRRYRDRRAAERATTSAGPDVPGASKRRGVLGVGRSRQTEQKPRSTTGPAPTEVRRVRRGAPGRRGRPDEEALTGPGQKAAGDR